MKSDAEHVSNRVSDKKWQLLVIALPVGVLANNLFGVWGNLPQAVMTLMGWLNEPSFVQRHIASLTSSLLVPGLLVFLVLSLTPIGDWLVPNRLALGCLLAADVLLVAVAMGGLYLASIHEPPFLRGVTGNVFGTLLITTFVIGLSSLAMSTVWHRILKTRPRAVAFCQSVLRQV
jgi:hypothetical protein